MRRTRIIEELLDWTFTPTCTTRASNACVDLPKFDTDRSAFGRNRFSVFSAL